MMQWDDRYDGELAPRRAPRSGRAGGRRLAAALVSVAVLGALWFFFAPTRFGGSADYVVTYGISMEPRFHAGDLAVVRAASRYRVGEIVAYRNRELGRVVLHRIVGRIGDRYVFKGDNNNFVDPYHPTRSELIGRLWFHVPRVGAVFTWLQAPRHSALAAGLAVLLLGLLGGGAASRRRKRSAARDCGVRPRAAGAAGWPHQLLAVALASALAFGLLAAVAYTRSVTRTIAVPGYTNQGAYDYSARVPRSTVYPSGRLGTGQTLFARLVHRADLGFSYRFVSALPHAMRGSAQLRLTLASSLGWTVALPSPPRRTFAGDSVRLTQSLDVVALEKKIASYLTRTGIVSDSFTLTATPRIRVRGTVAGQAVDSVFAPTPLTLVVDQAALRLADAGATGGLPGQQAPDPLHPSAAGTVTGSAPRTIGLPGRSLPVTSARRIALWGLAAAGALLALALAVLAATRRGGEAARINRRYRHLLVPVSEASWIPAGNPVDVGSVDELARIADHHGQLVLWQHEDGCDRYHVVADGIAYRYMRGLGAPGPRMHVPARPAASLETVLRSTSDRAAARAVPEHRLEQKGA